MIKNLALVLVTTTRSIRPYFQSYQIMVRTNHPIQIVIKKPKLVGRMTVWSIKLLEFGIKYEPRGPMKAQCLANFVAKLSTKIESKSEWWRLNVDGSSNEKKSRTEVILESLDEVILEQSLRFEFETTNNQGKYETLVAGLRLAKEVRVKYLKCWSDSQLITSQLNGEYSTKDPQMTRYYHMATRLKDAFVKFEIKHIA